MGRSSSFNRSNSSRPIGGGFSRSIHSATLARFVLGMTVGRDRLLMRGARCGKHVAWAIGLGHEEQVVGFGGSQRGFERGAPWIGDRSRRQTGVLIGVVRILVQQV